MRKVALGMDIKHFTEHDPVGRYLIDRAHLVRAEALGALATADYTDTKLLIQLQHDAALPELVLRWLEEALDDATEAEELILAEDQLDSGY
jgi:hypothetical protein